MATSFTSIPVIDYSLSKSPATKAKFVADLQNALVRVGFFYLIRHPIADEVLNNLTEQSRLFFDLPLDSKMEADMMGSKHFLGYVPPSHEQTAKKTDHRETFTVGRGFAEPTPEKPLYHNLKGPNKWPKESDVPGFQLAIQEYFDAVCDLADEFKIFVAEALGLEPSALLKYFDAECPDRLKLNKYDPPSIDESEEDRFQGNGPHKDSSVLTFIYQGTPHNGLEAQNKSGQWIPVPQREDAIVVNVGRILEAMTGGVCTAATHQVVLSPEYYVDESGNSLGPRMTFPLLQLLGLDLTKEQMTLKIPQHITNMVKDEKVKSDAEKFFQEIFRNSAGHGVFSSRVLKHADVSQKWYPDVLAEFQRAQQLEVKTA